jgi:hypothetical protein
MSQAAWNNSPFRIGDSFCILLMRDNKEQYKIPGLYMGDLTTVQKQRIDE